MESPRDRESVAPSASVAGGVAGVEAVAAKRQPGRNLPWAIAVGCLLAGITAASLFLAPWAFMALVGIALGVGVTELVLAMRLAGHVVPLRRVLATTGLMVCAAYWGGAPGLLAAAAFGLGLLAVTYRLGGGMRGDDCVGALFVLVYVGVLGSTAVLLANQPQGPFKVVFFILLTACSDIGGYVVGVMMGKTPMAPQVSPKKSWEGFSGSVAVCSLVGAVALPLLTGNSWWLGALCGPVAASLATVGDLMESLIKRDLGVKDLGTLLPGHGGLMDRLDSLLLTAPAAWLLFTALA